MKNGWNSERVIAIARLVIMLVSAVAGGFGLTLDPESLSTIAACGIALVAGVWSWWSNNNVTKAAQTAQDYLNGIKASVKEL